MHKLKISVQEHDSVKKINPGFQNPHRPPWYFATQEAIVPREPFFAQLCRQLMDECGGAGSKLHIFEPGAGLGAFFHFALTRSPLPERCELHLIGADVSAEMVQGCCDLLREICVPTTWKAVTIELHTRLNLLALSGSGIERLTERGPFDVILASQFEHSYPNRLGSPLAVGLAAEGIVFSTKHDFRRFAWRQLRPQGLYYAVDDYLTGDPAEDERQTLAWDTAVVRRLSDPTFVGALRERFPRIAAALERRYHASCGEEILLQKVAHARHRRRLLCNEETATLPDSLQDLRDLFGADRVEATRHSSSAHRQFYMLRARR
jgi:hypothetical protein